MRCPTCKTINPDVAKFCMNCGTPLGAAPAAQSAAGVRGQESDLDRYLPPELLRKFEAARSHHAMAGERRVITMLFCDVKGSTAAAEKLDPEVWTEIMNGVFEHMIRPIYRYEGLVPRLMGDAILAFFGAPIAHEDDPQRAVLAGLEIQQEVRTYAEAMGQRHGVEFGLRVGINTGLVVVGEIGSDLRMEYTAIGDAINLAARMEQTAAVGTVQISEDTYKLVAPFFEFESLGQIEVKGKSVPVKTYRVLGVKGTPDQVRGLQGLSSPLVGRDAQLVVLSERLAGLEQGSGSVVVVQGEAGLGKSTLIAQLRRGDQDGQFVWLRGEALSYARSISYFLWRQILRQSIQVQENESPAEVRARLEGISREASPFLEAILAIESDESMRVLAELEGDALRRRIVGVVRDHLGNLGGEKPLVIVMDDLHWADEASLRLLTDLIDLAMSQSILFICLLRPDHAAEAWDTVAKIEQAATGSFTRIELRPLSAQDAAVLLTNLIGTETLPKSMLSTIVEKSNGNPFFAEELIRSLIETKQIVRENSHWKSVHPEATLSLPNSLRGLLSARIDRLPEPVRHLLQNAAVVGRTFDLRVLHRLDAGNTDLDSQIRELQEAGLIEPSGDEFVFRHVLMQDAAYDSILIRERVRLHRQIGEALEELYGDRLAERAAVIAHHYSAAGDTRSLKYEILAGENAARVYANVEAAAHFERALEVAKRESVDAAKISMLHSRRGAVLELAGRYEQALANYREMLAFGREHGQSAMEMGALMAQATLYSTYTSLHDPIKSEQTLMQALSLSRALGDKVAEAKLNWNLMLNYLYSSRLDRALEHGERALDLAQGLEQREPLAYVLNDLCRLYVCLGRIEDAHAVIAQARELWRELGNAAMLADSLGSEAEAYFQSGEHDKALELIGQGLALSQEIDNLWGSAYNRMLMSFIHFDRGEIGRGIQLSRASIEEGERGGLAASATSHRAELGWFQGIYGDFPGGLELAAQALQRADAHQPGFRALPLAFMVRLHLLKGEVAEAEKVAGPVPLQPISIPYIRYTVSIQLANIGLALARGHSELALTKADELLSRMSSLTRVDTPDVLRHKAEALIAMQRYEQALNVLHESRAHAETMGSRHHLWSTLAALAKLCLRLGRQQQAETYRLQARQIVAWIAEGLTDVGLRESFLSDERVRALER